MRQKKFFGTVKERNVEAEDISAELKVELSFAVKRWLEGGSGVLCTAAVSIAAREKDQTVVTQRLILALVEQLPKAKVKNCRGLQLFQILF